MAQYIESLDFTPVVPTASPAVDIAKPRVEAEVRPELTWKPEQEPSWVDAEVEVTVATYQAYQILYYGLIALMGVSGLDKFLRLMANWDTYVSPGIAKMLHMSPTSISMFAGLIELAVAVVVALKPRIGSWVFTGWMGLIVVNLLTMSGHYDMALQALAFAAAGFAFTRLSAECN